MILGVDAFSKRIFTGFINTENASAAQTTRVVEPWLRENGYKVVYSDNGSEYKAKVFNEMLANLNVKHIYSSTKWSNKTSLAEIWIKQWKQKLSKILASKMETSILKALNLTTQLLNENPKTETV